VYQVSTTETETWVSVACVLLFVKIIGLFCKRALQKRRYIFRLKSNTCAGQEKLFLCLFANTCKHTQTHANIYKQTHLKLRHVVCLRLDMQLRHVVYQVSTTETETWVSVALRPMTFATDACCVSSLNNWDWDLTHNMSQLQMSQLRILYTHMPTYAYMCDMCVVVCKHMQTCVTCLSRAWFQTFATETCFWCLHTMLAHMFATVSLENKKVKLRHVCKHVSVALGCTCAVAHVYMCNCSCTWLHVQL